MSSPGAVISLVEVSGKSRKVKLLQELASGGAGNVFSVQGEPGSVVKIYHQETLSNEGSSYEAKIAGMLKHVPSLPAMGELIQMSWPVAVARDIAGSFLGYAMPMIDMSKTELLESMLQPMQAKKRNLRSDLGARITVAANLAGVVSALHTQGHHIVDLKPPNLRFYRKELYVAVLDCDGFEIKMEGRTFSAPQATSEYLAPEYHQEAISDPELQDRFALAVIIFRLLNFGIHPYDGQATDNRLPTDREGRVSKSLYPYGKIALSAVSPLLVSAHQTFPEELRHYFDRAFSTSPSSRPSSQEWSNLLRKYAERKNALLAPCKAGHLWLTGKPCGECHRNSILLGIPPMVDVDVYTCPSLSILTCLGQGMTDSEDFKEQRARSLQKMFEQFKVGCQVIGRRSGPSITQYELSLNEGTRVSKVTRLSDNMALTLGVPKVNLVVPIPGRNTIGIEVPNFQRAIVNLRSILELPECQNLTKQMLLPLILGQDVLGAPLVEDLAKMPLLVTAGTKGTDTLDCLNSIILSLIFHQTPEQLRLLILDPKSLEMSGYEELPHLMLPVITNMDEASGVWEWACRAMEDRFAMLNRVKVREIASYNQLKRENIVAMVGGEEGMTKMEFPMPHIVIIVNDCSDLLSAQANEIENYITRLTQKSRTVGLHVILATQHPTVAMIKRLIKTHVPARMAFQVDSAKESRIILDQNGAETLMGQGDMLFMPLEGTELVRAQGIKIHDDEISNVVKFWKAQLESDLVKGFLKVGESALEEKYVFRPF